MIVVSMMAYESLDLNYFCGWTENSEGKICQVAFSISNNGTKILDITDLWINETVIGSDEWIGGFKLAPQCSHQFYVTLRAWAFVKGESYKFVIHTASERNYSVVFRCEDTNVYVENLAVLEWYALPEDEPYQSAAIVIRYRNYGRTPIIVTRVVSNLFTRDMRQWTWPSGSSNGDIGALTLKFDWRHGFYYYFRIETASATRTWSQRSPDHDRSDGP